ncbi:protein FAM162B-like [Latimeria chalumnae]|uniref:protein FAM162B-like n=1 Tax=Latimeria chalumnae TaxID=7897 RepID=UPI00313E8FBB
MFRSVFRDKLLVTRVFTKTSNVFQRSRDSHNVQYSRRAFCMKTNESKEKTIIPHTTAFPGSGTYKLQGRKLTPFDKKLLLWAGRFRKEEEIPEVVSMQMLNAAKNKVRIKACYVAIGLTLLACFAMIISGKSAVNR